MPRAVGTQEEKGKMMNMLTLGTHICIRYAFAEEHEKKINNYGYSEEKGTKK